MVKNELEAYIGLDNIRNTGEWEGQNFDLLKIVSDIINSVFKRRQLEWEIDESQTLLKKLASTPNDGIIIINNENKIIFWNKRAEEILGYRKDEVLDLPLIDVLISKKYQAMVEFRLNSFQGKLDKDWYRKVNHSFITNKYGVQIPVEISHSMTSVKGIRYG
ncbi:MAG: PAS domain S-box protein, partial [Candidatus Lokiarchaeota archaeon]|nr:PAS domain S-box protein [Candidatus Lokiarchaeota archaeon]